MSDRWVTDSYRIDNRADIVDDESAANPLPVALDSYP